MQQRGDWFVKIIVVMQESEFCMESQLSRNRILMWQWTPAELSLLPVTSDCLGSHRSEPSPFTTNPVPVHGGVVQHTTRRPRYIHGLFTCQHQMLRKHSLLHFLSSFFCAQPFLVQGHKQCRVLCTSWAETSCSHRDPEVQEVRWGCACSDSDVLKGEPLPSSKMRNKLYHHRLI